MISSPKSSLDSVTSTASVVLLIPTRLTLSLSYITDPTFRLVYRAFGSRATIIKISIHLGCCVLTMRAKDWTRKITWVDLIRRQTWVTTTKFNPLSSYPLLLPHTRHSFYAVATQKMLCNRFLVANERYTPRDGWYTSFVHPVYTVVVSLLLCKTAMTCKTESTDGTRPAYKNNQIESVWNGKVEGKRTRSSKKDISLLMN